jgi:hypothetical protein
MMLPPIEDLLARAFATDVLATAFRILAPDVSPDGTRAAALVISDGPGEPIPLEAFFAREGDDWVGRGEIHELGPGEWDFGDLSFPFLSGRVRGGVAVELRLGPHTLRRPIAHGYFLGVFWDAGLASEDPGLDDDDARTPRLYRTVG